MISIYKNSKVNQWTKIHSSLSFAKDDDDIPMSILYGAVNSTVSIECFLFDTVVEVYPQVEYKTFPVVVARALDNRFLEKAIPCKKALNLLSLIIYKHFEKKGGDA